MTRDQSLAAIAALFLTALGFQQLILVPPAIAAGLAPAALA